MAYRSKVKVFVWLPPLRDSALSALLTFGKSVGHASIQIGETYVSFYPQDSSKAYKGDVDSRLVAFSKEVASRGKPDRTVELRNLNTSRMLRRWREMRQNSYNLLRSNCSNIVVELLKEGAPDDFTIGRFNNDNPLKALGDIRDVGMGAMILAGHNITWVDPLWALWFAEGLERSVG
jgi:hypothetical protein